VILPAPILVITDRTQCAGALEARIASLFRGGCRWLSVREKDMEHAGRRALLERLVAIARPFGAVVGVHDDLDAAMALGIPLHLPAHADVAAARRAIGDALLGKSCHDAAEIAAAAANGADYVTLSPFFPSAGKPGYRAGADLHAVAAGAPLPVLALGGITRATLPQLSGLAGAAIMGEAMRTAEPEGWFAGLTTASASFRTA
jgi:thiamine-phosphate pyrophosphorylase